MGIVRARQPCTAYAVRRELQQSPSSHWSGSAGAIYPLLERLHTAGLVESRLDEADRRGRRMMRLAPKGRAAHRRWMMRASSPDVAAGVSDAVRSRAFFLSALSPGDRGRFVDETLGALEDLLRVTKEDLARRDDLADSFARLAAEGGVYQAEALVGLAA